MVILLTFGVPAILFIAFERVFALRPQRVFRTGWRADVCHALLAFIPVGIMLVVVNATVGATLRGLTPDSTRAAVGSLPFVVQLALVVALCELGMYWSHRLEHEVPFLWRFHAVHHSSTELDWLSTERTHPVDGVFRKLFLVPLYAVGFSVTGLGIYLTVYYLWSFVVHANVRWRFGPLEDVIASPAFHHWHHAAEPEARDTNYAPLFPVFDRVFGTLRRPGRMPRAYGSDAPVPAGYLPQLAYPFRPRRAPAARYARAVPVSP
jgi:sterol desaturase/sphingolipid hydroxylase (fatty acid hydroxylase superfamily)